MTTARQTSPVSGGERFLAGLRTRRSRPSLSAPAPSDQQLHELLTAASCVPDHGRLRPWRFIVFDTAATVELGAAFAAAHEQRDPSASATDLARTRARPQRAPAVVAVVAVPQAHQKVPLWEQRAAACCVAYGLVLAADAAGFGAMWRTGWYGEAPLVRRHLGLLEHEELIGWIYLGTPAGPAPPARELPEPPVRWL